MAESVRTRKSHLTPNQVTVLRKLASLDPNDEATTHELGWLFPVRDSRWRIAQNILQSLHTRGLVSSRRTTGRRIGGRRAKPKPRVWRITEDGRGMLRAVDTGHVKVVDWDR